MKGFQWLFVGAIFCVQLKYSFQVQEVFGLCVDDTDCPDYSTCVQLTTGELRCRCDAGFDAIDVGITSDGKSVTECRDLGICSPFDNVESDCGANGQCVTYTDNYGVVQAACRCKRGYSGLNCDQQVTPVTLIPPYTTRRPFMTTRRPGNLGAIIPAIGGGVLLLALLAGGAAAIASTSG